MNQANARYISLTLHTHLPYVVNHGTWPHGMEWLCEAAAECYLPILRTLRQLEHEGCPLKLNMSFTPILLEQLAHPVFKSEFAEYLQRKVAAAVADEKRFDADSNDQLVQLAQHWQQYFGTLEREFESLNRDIIGGFRRLQDSGSIELLTSGASHGYFPLLGTDSAIRAQVRLAVEVHGKYFDRAPRGMWLPECGYRPGGIWRRPMAIKGLSRITQRDGFEKILAESGVEYFFADTHLVEKGAVFNPYEVLAGDAPVSLVPKSGTGSASIYQPHLVKGSGVAFFTRDPRTSVQVWSGSHGYPGGYEYLEFHKRNYPGGHRYWKVTGSNSGLEHKQQYDPDRAQTRVKEHAAHFACITAETLAKAGGVAEPPILSAPFDTELFGHWWHEGPQFLLELGRELSQPGSPLQSITAGDYLHAHPAHDSLPLNEGSWGRNGAHEMWLNPGTEWMWKHIYQAEVTVQRVVDHRAWHGNGVATRLVEQLCRELLILESSDWEFLFTMGTARDYAGARFQGHADQLSKLVKTWERFLTTGEFSADAIRELDEAVKRDSVFPSLKPELWKK